MQNKDVSKQLILKLWLSLVKFEVEHQDVTTRKNMSLRELSQKKLRNGFSQKFWGLYVSSLYLFPYAHACAYSVY
jgi:hypothetical protein